MDFILSRMFIEMLLSFIGFSAVTTVIIALFAPLGGHADGFFATSRPELGSEEFIDTLSHVLTAPVETGGEAEVLNNGDEFFPRLLADIRSAQKNINFLAYIWETGTLSATVVEALVDRARQGVQVRLLLDSFGGNRLTSSEQKTLEQGGVRVAWFRTARLGRLTRFHRRTHRRAIVIDGLVGYTGGMAIADKWLGDGRRPGSWRDSMTRLTGSLVRHAQSAFAQLWAATSGEILSGKDFYPQTPNASPSPIRSVSLISSPSTDTEPLPIFFWYAFAMAKRSICIATPYFVPARPIRRVLIEAAKRGVQVSVLLPGRLTDTNIVRLAGQYHFREFLKAGIRIFEYQPNMMHRKAVAIDGTWSIVGSANMDSRSSLLDEENVLGISSQKLAGKLEQDFQEDLKFAKEITWEQWKKSSLLRKIISGITVRFSKQF